MDNTDLEPKKAFSFTVFLQQMKEEFHKISWTDRKDLIRFAKLVVVSTFIFGMSVYVIDLIIKSSLDGIAHLFRSLFA